LISSNDIDDLDQIDIQTMIKEKKALQKQKQGKKRKRQFLKIVMFIHIWLGF